MKTTWIEGSERELDYSFVGGDLLLEERKGYGTEYDVIYYQLNVGDGYFEWLLEEQAEPDKNLWETIAKEFASRMGRRVPLEEAGTHRQMIYDNYLDPIILSKHNHLHFYRYVAEIQGNEPAVAYR